jgi:hypothetical protein
MRSFVVKTQEWVTDVSSSEDSSDEDEIAGVALTDFESPLPPPPMCLMAKGNSKVSDGESDDELDPNESSNLRTVRMLCGGDFTGTREATWGKARRGLTGAWMAVWHARLGGDLCGTMAERVSAAGTARERGGATYLPTRRRG